MTSLRTSPQTGVAISNGMDMDSLYLGDSHASVSTGSE